MESVATSLNSWLRSQAIDVKIKMENTKIVLNTIQPVAFLKIKLKLVIVFFRFEYSEEHNNCQQQQVLPTI